MKKTLERLSFMMLGAVIAASAYYFGSTDSTANPSNAIFQDVIIEGNLGVRGAIVVGDESVESANLVMIDAAHESAAILLRHNIRNRGKIEDAVLMLTTHSSDDGIPSSSILLKDINGNTSYGSSIRGWKKR